MDEHRIPRARIESHLTWLMARHVEGLDRARRLLSQVREGYLTDEDDIQRRLRREDDILTAWQDEQRIVRRYLRRVAGWWRTWWW